jgi:hypothetical protein
MIRLFVPLGFLLAIPLFFQSCTTQDTEKVAKLTQVIDSLQHELDSLRGEYDRVSGELEIVNVQLDELAGLVPQDSDGGDAEEGLLRTGKHAFTLQWISWDEPGSVEIQSAGNGWYTVQGGQESSENDNFITIDGKLKPLSERELKFEGRIESQIDHLFGGEVCVREGEQLFKATGKRKYWRLQNMTNCEGGRVTDYVDIYF